MLLQHIVYSLFNRQWSPNCIILIHRLGHNVNIFTLIYLKHIVCIFSQYFHCHLIPQCQAKEMLIGGISPHLRCYLENRSKEVFAQNQMLFRCSANWPYGFSRYQVRSTTGSLGTGPSWVSWEDAQDGAMNAAPITISSGYMEERWALMSTRSNRTKQL